MFQKRSSLCTKWNCSGANGPPDAGKPLTSAAFPHQVMVWCISKEMAPSPAKVLNVNSGCPHPATQLPHSPTWPLCLSINFKLFSRSSFYISTPKVPRGHAQKNLRKSHICTSFHARPENPRVPRFRSTFKPALAHVPLCHPGGLIFFFLSSCFSSYYINWIEWVHLNFLSLYMHLSNNLVMSQKREKKKKRKKTGPGSSASMPCTLPISKLIRSPLPWGRVQQSKKSVKPGHWKAGGLIKHCLLNTRAWGRDLVLAGGISPPCHTTACSYQWHRLAFQYGGQLPAHPKSCA